MTKRKIIIIAFSTFLCILLLSTLLFFTYPRVTIKATYSTPIDVQLFYDTGNGINETDSITKEIKKPEQVLRFRVPDEDILTLRIDFGEKPGEIAIDTIAIRYIGKNVVLQGKEIQETFDTKSQLNRDWVQDNQFWIQSSTKDPYILNTTGEIGLNAGALRWQFLQKIIIRLITLAIFLLIYLLATYFYLNQKDLFESKRSLTLFINQFKNKYLQYSTKNKRLIVCISILVGFFINIASGTLNFNHIIYSLISVYDLIIATIMSSVVIIILMNIKIRITFQTISKKEWIIYSTIIFLFFIIFFIAYYPAGMTSDSINQWRQVTTGQYNDWHPAAHTFIFMHLPSLIWGNPASATLFQMLFIAIMMGYIAYSLRRWGISRKIVLLFLLLYLIHPSNQRIAVTLWKDVAYSFSLLVFSVMCMWIVFTDGEWIQSIKHVAWFCMISLGVLLMRHNGVLSFIPTIICLALVHRHYRKTFVIIGSSLLIFKLILTGPGYQLLGVQSHNQSFAEAMGIPNNQISHIITNNGLITDEQLAFIDQIAPIEQWKANYYPDTINPLKWAADEDQQLYFDAMFIEENKIEYLKTWVNLVSHNFGLAVESYYNVTHIIWDFEVRYDGTERTPDNDDIEPLAMLKIKENMHEKVYQYIMWCENGWFKVLTPSVGLAFFIMNMAVFCSMTKNKKKIVPYIPILCNTLGIMCLMTGGVARYTYINIIGMVPIVIFSLLGYHSNKINQRKSNNESTQRVD